VRPARQRRRKERRARAAARRLPPVHGHPGSLPTGGHAAPVRVVGIGRFAEGVVRQSHARPRRGGRRWVAVATTVLIVVLAALFLVGRLVGHL